MGALGRCLTAAVSALALSWSGAASAQQGAAEAAREAFSAGLAAESAGRSDEACASFRKSLALVRELGPLQKSAACDEREGKLKSAAALLEELLLRLPAGEPERAAVEDRLRLARSRLGAVAIVVRPGAPSGIQVRVDGALVAVPAEEILVDPGQIELVVEVPGRGVELSRIEVGAGGRTTVTIPAEAPPTAAIPPPPAPPGATSAAETEPSHPLRTAGWVLGGVGVAGFIGVAATGIPLLGKSSEFDECADVDCEERVSNEADPLVAANAVMWGVGIAGVALGATFLLVDATSSGAEVTGALGPGGATVRGRF